jgi:hypothetical protein
MSTEDNSTVGMTVKDMVIEVFNDMKIVRPIAEALQRADLPTRVTKLESTASILDALAPATLYALNQTTDHVTTLWLERQTQADKSLAYAGLRGLANSAVAKIIAMSIATSSIIGVLVALGVIH